jgi:putative pyruvate formate lyase activating enzyme
MKKQLLQCTLCPRACGVDRNSEPGFCGTGTGFEVASVTVHHGEEPVISGTDGICNIFFAGCNLHCIYCQNHQISSPRGRISPPALSLSKLIDRIIAILDQGIENIGLVSPSHMVPQARTVIEELHQLGYFPIVVYNTNAYEKVEILRSLEGLVDVYLPDFKYMDSTLAARWSGAADYPEVACAAMKEMYRQKGNRLLSTHSGKISSGMIVRHLVLPEAVANSIGVLRFLASELSCRLAVSLMAQYHPTRDVMNVPPLHRKITASEYQQVVREVERLGFENGWFQDYDSAEVYIPDFTLPAPFGG